jgi:dienelactone hydrolase
LTTPSIANAVAASGARLEISPATAFIDDELSIRILGLKARETVTIRASTEDDEKRVWSSHATFAANSSGSVDVSSQETLSGTYRGVSPMGLFWSMNLEGEEETGRATFVKKNATTNKVTLEVRSAERVIAATYCERSYLAPGTQTRDLQLPGEPVTNSTHTVGRLSLPPGAKAGDRLPVVIVLSGSGGGFDLDKAALIARHGFATFALAYFGTPPLPTWLHHIPLEYFEGAFGWLCAQPEVDPKRLGMLAVSRGAELALLLGSRFPQIRAVVAYAPSSVVWAAGGRDKETGELPPSWTHGGEAIPFVPLPLRQFIFRSAIPVALLKRPVMFRDLFSAGLRNSKAVAAAAIPVEQIHGPIMLISSGDDHLWPAKEMSDAIVARLEKYAFAHRVEHLHYSNAGHMLRYPYLPTTARDSRNPHLRNARYSFGGTAPADAEAQADSWRHAIAFLKSNLT